MKKTPTLQLSLDSFYQNASVQVDLVGINNSQYQSWRAKSVDEYFSPGDVFRESANKKVYTFGQGMSITQMLSRDDPIWDTWKRNKVSYLVMLADLPGYTAPEQPFDRRRQFIPLDRKKWKPRPNQIEIQISPTGITLIPAPIEVDY